MGPTGGFGGKVIWEAGRRIQGITAEGKIGPVAISHEGIEVGASDRDGVIDLGESVKDLLNPKGDFKGQAGVKISAEVCHQDW